MPLKVTTGLLQQSGWLPLPARGLNLAGAAAGCMQWHFSSATDRACLGQAMQGRAPQEYCHVVPLCECNAYPPDMRLFARREAGVRNLKKLLEKAYRKVALKLVKQGLQGPQAAAAADGSEQQAQPGETVVDEPQPSPPDAGQPPPSECWSWQSGACGCCRTQVAARSLRQGSKQQVRPGRLESNGLQPSPPEAG